MSVAGVPVRQTVMSGMAAIFPTKLGKTSTMAEHAIMIWRHNRDNLDRMRRIEQCFSPARAICILRCIEHDRFKPPTQRMPHQMKCACGFERLFKIPIASTCQQAAFSEAAVRRIDLQAYCIIQAMAPGRLCRVI